MNAVAAVLEFVGANWKLFALVAIVCGAYVKGCTDEKERFDEFVAAEKRVGEAQAKWSQQRRAEGKSITARKDAENAELKHQRDLAVGHVGVLADELQKRPGRSILPPVPAAAEGGAGTARDRGIACFARDTLRVGIEAALSGFGERYRGLVRRGAGAIDDFQTCAAWALEQEAAAAKK